MNSRNRYVTHCAECGTTVERGHGYLYRLSDSFLVRCPGCDFRHDCLEAGQIEMDMRVAALQATEPGLGEPTAIRMLTPEVTATREGNP